MQEEPLFIPHEGSQLFGVLHYPGDSPPGNAGVVICEAFAEEKLWSQRLIVGFARRLAAQGCWVLRFDCRGHGDSGGEFEDSTVETRLSDISRAVAFLRERAAVSVVGLLGLRFGGTLAALAASRGIEAGFLVLWNPVVQGERYFLECLRSNLATQMATYKKIVCKREDMIRALGEGKPVNIDGYLVSPVFYREVARVDLQQGLAPFAKPLLVVQASKAADARLDQDLSGFCEKVRSDGAPVDVRIVQAEPFWKETRWFFTSSEPLFSETLQWIEGVTGTRGASGGTSGNLS